MAALLVLLTPGNLLAAPGDLLLTIPNPDPHAGDRFGWSVATVGPNIAVGAIGDDSAGVSSRGRVYVFDGQTGLEKFRISNPAPASNLFGHDIESAGQNFIATQNNWTYLFDGATGDPLLTLSHPITKPHVAYAGGNIFIGGENGVPFRLYNGTTGELIRVYDQQAPSYTKSIATLGDRFVVGEFIRRAVVVYDSQTGDEIMSIPYDGSEVDHTGFGRSVASMGPDILVGDDEFRIRGTTNAGRVQLYDGTTGELKLNILNPTPVANEDFGINVVALHHHFAVALHQDSNPRSVEIFGLDGQTPQSIVNPLSGVFGSGSDALADFHGDLLVGAITARVGDVSAGAVYKFAGFPAPEPSGAGLTTLALLIVGSLCRRRSVITGSMESADLHLLPPPSKS